MKKQFLSLAIFLIQLSKVRIFFNYLGTPFLVLLDSEHKTDKPVFIHLDTLSSISDEVELKTACSFSLHLLNQEFRAVCFTSTDYQDWIQALEISHEMVNISAEKKHQPIQIGLESAVPLTSTLQNHKNTARNSRQLARAYTDNSLLAGTSMQSNVLKDHLIPERRFSTGHLSFEADNSSLQEGAASDKE